MKAIIVDGIKYRSRSAAAKTILSHPRKYKQFQSPSVLAKLLNVSQSYLSPV
jgi:hypothetical protein